MADAALPYEEEQRRLREGEPLGSPEDQVFEPPEVDPEVYRDVEPLIFKGFLYQAATIGSVNLVFKTLNHHEIETLNLTYKLSRAHKDVQRYYARFLAYGVWMVDGRNVLVNREDHLDELTDFFGGMAGKARDLVVRHMGELNRRASRAVVLSEAYATETVSRYRWGQYRALNLMDPTVTGVEGTQNLGLNWGQLIWSAWNYYEDRREKSEAEWENAKFIASAFAGKGINQVHSRDKSRRKNELQDRQERKDRILRFALLGEDPEKTTTYDGQTMIVAKTVDQLADQLKRDLKGERDWHDMVVDEYERQARERWDNRQREIQEFREAHAAEGVLGVQGGQADFGGLTRDEVEQRLKERQERISKRIGKPVKYPELVDPGHAEKVSKWMNAETWASASASNLTNRPVGKPWRGKQ